MTHFHLWGGAFDQAKRVGLTPISYVAATRAARVASATDPPASTNAMARPARARTRKNGGVRGHFEAPAVK